MNPEYYDDLGTSSAIIAKKAEEGKLKFLYLLFSGIAEYSTILDVCMRKGVKMG